MNPVEIHMNPLVLPNVTLHPELDVQDKEKYGFDSQALRTVIWETATRFPMWDIVITGVKNNHIDSPFVSGIAVMSGREKLGTVKLEYVGRGYERKLSIQNKRIDQSLERARAMHTEDPKRAMAIIKKWFRNKTTAEHVADGLGVAQIVYNALKRNAHNTKINARETVQTMAFDFIMNSPEVRTELAKFIAVDPSMHKRLVEAYNAHDEAEAEEMGLQSFDKGAHTIIAIDGGYIVCHNDTVSSYTDATLPDNLRAPLGMLKLVNAKELIKGVGFKADNNVFVVKPSEIE